MDLCQRLRVSVWSNEGFDIDMRRYQITEHGVTTLRFGPLQSIYPCKKFVADVFGVGTGYLYYAGEGGKQSFYPSRTSDKQLHVMAWFDCLKDVCDPMPDGGDEGADGKTHRTEWQVFFPSRQSVYHHYLDDRRANPEVWVAVSRVHFMRVWRQSLDNFKLRKHLKFTKCSECVDLRQVHNRSHSTVSTV